MMQFKCLQSQPCHQDVGSGKRMLPKADAHQPAWGPQRNSEETLGCLLTFPVVLRTRVLTFTHMNAHSCRCAYAHYTHHTQKRSTLCQSNWSADQGSEVSRAEHLDCHTPSLGQCCGSLWRDWPGGQQQCWCGDYLISNVWLEALFSHLLFKLPKHRFLHL